MNNINGKRLEGIEHLKQSIRDILTTPIGSRVMRRDYGSRLFELVDHPLDGNFLVDVYAESAAALKKWEPRFRPIKFKTTNINSDGNPIIDMYGEYLPDGQMINIDGIVIT